jgi:hypothetical protein
MDRVTRARLVVVEPVVTAAVETAMRRSSEREGVRARGIGTPQGSHRKPTGNSQGKYQYGSERKLL